MLIEKRKTKSGPRFLVVQGGKAIGIFGSRAAAHRFVWQAAAYKRQAGLRL